MCIRDRDLTLHFDPAAAQKLLAASGPAGVAIDTSHASLAVIYSYGDFTATTNYARSDDPAAAPIHIDRAGSIPSNSVESFFQNPFANLNAARTAPLRIQKALISQIPDTSHGWFVALWLYLFVAFYAMGPGVCAVSYTHLNMGGIALMWRGGCIIRSRFLGKIKAAFDTNPSLENLLLDRFFSDALNLYQGAWRKAVGHAVELGVPTPAFSTALAFFDGYRTARLPANLLQAQRDFFGAHTYERVDQPRGKFFHTNWTGRGGRVSSTTYNV